MYEVSIRDHISSAHFLREYEGKCKNLHGHTWKIEVTIKNNDLDHVGMVMDFIDLKKHLKSFLIHLDHVCLNDLEYFKKVNPTTENLAKYIFDNFKPSIEPLTINKIRVWESDTSSVTYYEE